MKNSGKMTKITIAGKVFPITSEKEINKSMNIIEDVIDCVGLNCTVIIIDKNDKYVEIKSRCTSSRFLTDDEILKL